MCLDRMIVFMILLTSLNACSKSQDIESELMEMETPESRSFSMGFTAFPYDLTPKALDETYRLVGQMGDLYVNHLDHGVPWEEALLDLPFPNEVQQTLDEAKRAIQPHQKLLLTATATAQTRNSIGQYWNNEGTQQPLSKEWAQKRFNDPDVIKAYKNYCERIIEFARPDYFAYGIEINASFQMNSAAFIDYLEFAEIIYHYLKVSYPDLPILLTFQDQAFELDHNELLKTTAMLLKFSDYIAMSTYPFWQYDHPRQDANPKYIPQNWLEDFRNLDPNKPFAISETGYCAEDMIIKAFGVDIKGHVDWQQTYMDMLFNKANTLKCEFINWFIIRDYDALYDQYYSNDPVTRIWRDLGILDGRGNERPAFQTWKIWYAKKKE